MKHALLAVLVPPSALLHPHVAVPPQDHATLDADVPEVQANCTLLLQTAGVPQA